LTNEKIRDDFLVFTAGMRIKYGIDQAMYQFKISDKCTGRLSFGYFIFVNLIHEIYRKATSKAVLKCSRHFSGEAKNDRESFLTAESWPERENTWKYFIKKSDWCAYGTVDSFRTIYKHIIFIDQSNLYAFQVNIELYRKTKQNTEQQ